MPHPVHPSSGRTLRIVPDPLAHDQTAVNAPLVHERGWLSTAVPATPAGVPPVILPKICNRTAPFGTFVRCDWDIWTAGSEGRVRQSPLSQLSLAPTCPVLMHCTAHALLSSIDWNLCLRSPMLWPRVVFLLLLPLGLGGCWERSARLHSPPTASSSRYEPLSPAGDDLPTPRLFRIEYSSESPD